MTLHIDDLTNLFSDEDLIHQLSKIGECLKQIENSNLDLFTDQFKINIYFDVDELFKTGQKYALHLTIRDYKESLDTPYHINLLKNFLNPVIKYFINIEVEQEFQRIKLN